MKRETQNVDFKQTWKDEYLEWICGYANAYGGKLYIGKDDEGKVVGVKDTKKLLEDIPNKLQNTMGIIADVNLRKTRAGEYVEIVVPPYPIGITYKGVYYYRSGATLQRLSSGSPRKGLSSSMASHTASRDMPLATRVSMPCTLPWMPFNG